MKLTQIGDADRLARKLQKLKDSRKLWSEVDLTDSLVTQRINSEARSPHRLPTLDDDLDMHQALVEAIVAEYEKLTGILNNYLLAKPLRYQRINDVVGACACAALELDRRLPQTKKFQKLILHQVAAIVYVEIGVPYERTKIDENGDIAEYGEPK